jgi:hypothetical protein
MIMRQEDQSCIKALDKLYGGPQGFPTVYQLIHSLPQVEGEIAFWGIDPFEI